MARALRGDGDLVHEFGDVLAWLGSLANLVGCRPRARPPRGTRTVARSAARSRAGARSFDDRRRSITPGDEHREELVGLMRVAFNLGSGALAERAAWLPVEKMRCVVEDGRIVAAAARARLPAVVRRARARDERDLGRRHVARTSRRRPRDARRHRAARRTLARSGQSLSALYPATQRPYRGMGYELAGTMTRHAVALDDLPRGPAGPLTVEEYVGRREIWMTCARATARRCRATRGRSTRTRRTGGRRGSSGMVQHDEQRAVVARGASGVEGYASFTFGSDRAAARVRVLDQLPAPGGDVGGGVGVVALVPARVPTVWGRR